MNQPKRFLDIVAEIRDMIKEQNIRPGERIPSERELAETLGVGRSTIREALRSLELLGLIETRRGEGTFLSDFRNHRLVEVLASFILQDPQSAEDVHKTRRIHEAAALKTVCESKELAKQPVWESFQIKIEQGNELKREDFVKELLVLSGNRLSLKIWLLLTQYSGMPFSEFVTEMEKKMLSRILTAIRAQQTEDAIRYYIEWSRFIQKGREQNDT